MICSVAIVDDVVSEALVTADVSIVLSVMTVGDDAIEDIVSVIVFVVSPVADVDLSNTASDLFLSAVRR